MNFNRKLINKDLKNLKDDGLVILPNFISEANLTKMNQEIKPWLKRISFNNNFSSSIIGNNQWIAHLGLCSKSAINIALDKDLIIFLEKFFNKSISLAEFTFQKKIISEKKIINWHIDKGKGIMVFIFLTHINSETGATKFIPKTHKIKFNENRANQKGIAEYLDNLVIEKKINRSVQVVGGPGTVVIFNPSTWHSLPAFTKAGREVIWLKYIPKTSNEEAVDHLYRQTFLSDLNKKQLQVFCINQQKNKREGITQLGSQSFIGDEYYSNYKMFLYYIRYLLLSLFQKK